MNSILQNTSFEIEDVADLHPERKIQILDSQYETLYQSINKLAANITNTPIAMITFLNGQQVWMEFDTGYSEILQKTQIGIFLSWAIDNDQYIEISDMSLISNPSARSLHTYQPNLRFYAGVPIKLPLGEVTGVLSVFDHKPNSMNPQQRNMLAGLAAVVAKTMVFKQHLMSNKRYA